MSCCIALRHITRRHIAMRHNKSHLAQSHHILLNHITSYHITYFHFTILSYSFSLTELCIHWGRLERQRGKYCNALPWRIVRYSLSIGASQNVNMNMRALYCNMSYYASLLVIVRDFSFVNFNMTIITILNVFQFNFNCTYYFIFCSGTLGQILWNLWGRLWQWELLVSNEEHSFVLHLAKWCCDWLQWSIPHWLHCIWSYFDSECLPSPPPNHRVPLYSWY